MVGIVKVATPRQARKKVIRIAVSEANLRKAASRLLGAKLVSPEVSYIQRELGASATQEDVDAKVLSVRSMPWSSIVIPD